MTKSHAPTAYKPEVRAHYEALPYPMRRVEDEGKYFHGSEGYGAEALNHTAWAGRRDLRNAGRILIAGNGTGDASVQWAESLHGSNAEIVAIDLSATSNALAQARLAKRQLTNVTFHHMSILDLPEAGLGQFDAIECTGVLHHLPDPDAGLRALASVLKDDGVMSLMVYAQYGRHAIYMVQEMMRRLMREGLDHAGQLALLRGFLDHVPTTHWLTVKNEAFLEDIRVPDGSGLYDLFLHSTDRAYTVPQIYDWVAEAGLQLHRWFGDFTDDCIYRPQHYTQHPEMLAAFQGKTEPELFAIGELMHGSMAKHHFYVSKQPLKEAQLEDDMVISYCLMQGIFHQHILGVLPELERASVGQRLSFANRPSPHAPAAILTKRASTAALIRAIDGHRTVAQLVQEVAGICGMDPLAVRADLAVLYQEMRARLMVNLRHVSVPAYPTVAQMFQRIQALGVR